MAKKTKLLKILTSVLVITMIISSALAVHMSATGTAADSPLGATGPSRYEGDFYNNYQQYFDSSVMYQLPDSISKDAILSIIVNVKSESLLDAYESEKRSISYEEFVTTKEADKIRASIAEKTALMQSKLDEAEIDYDLGASFDTLITGFEITTKAANYAAVRKTLDSYATVIVGEEYKVAETQLVENNVDYYEQTGIFDSSEFAYNGSGTLVAVLDTGLDYYHNAFSDENFKKHNSGNYSLTFDELTGYVSDLVASNLQSGLTASDLYISNKVPYAFDYADNDSDVYPLLNNHGTHVAGVVAGHEPGATDDSGNKMDFVGVAPGAQLAIMKIFSDVMETARTAWIINALEDCVTIGVDVINMSIGTSCGFSSITEEELNTTTDNIYNRIRARGINLVVAASNSYNSTYGSDKNGNLPLTSNPDSGTVGSPSTYSAALSVASINGKKTPYILSGERIIYFIESTDRVSEEKDFVKELLTGTTDTLEIEYVTIPGAGRSADYTVDVTGKIVLVRRGHTTFEEKAAVAKAKGAAGVIIYNNVSGDIKMNVGETVIPICSISQEDGEELAKVTSGKITIARSQASGPFISDFSSWGPAPDLSIKPEITAHGGNILSSVPGQSYDRISGTSMATPNISGFSALMRQYVVEKFPELKNDTQSISTMVNRLMMSTADIIIAKNGLPYAVRKQGAGLANLTKSSTTSAYIITYDRHDGSEMDKTKIELGDDPNKTGVYTLTFSVKNFGSTALSYNIGAYVYTEGVSENKTSHGETTSTQDSRLLDGAALSVKDVSGGQISGTKLTVSAGSSAKVTVTITLSDADKKYLNESFENGMYVEGFVTLEALDANSVDLNAPYLTFYGDWTQAPLFDLEYFETSKDELDDSIDMEDKTLPDAYATRPVGGTTLDYMSYLGSYYFIQEPGSTLIAADRNHISISNQPDALNSLRYVWAGMLRNADRAEVIITEDATGEIVYKVTDNDIRKSYGDGGAIRPAQIEIEFSAIEQNLKNNTAYTVTVKGYLDYDRDGEKTNLNNTITFPLVTDFQAPSITDCEFYTEYDRTTKKTRLFAKIAVYDNHHAMALQIGYIGADATYGAKFNQFDRYPTQVYSDFNSTTYVVYELTDYIETIANEKMANNCFVISAFDYAVNYATYEIPLPDDFTDFYFEEETITLSPNEIYDLNPKVYPDTEWKEFITYRSNNENIAKVVGNQLIATASAEKGGEARITATYTNGEKTITRRITVKVLKQGDEGYRYYDKPVMKDQFELTGYYTYRAFYQMDPDERVIGSTGDTMSFVNNNMSLSMYPYEAIGLIYPSPSTEPYAYYFPSEISIVVESANPEIVTVDESTYLITAKAEGRTSVTVRVLMNGESTYYSQTVSIEVKDPYITTGPSLTHYFGNGDNNKGRVTFPESLAITEIGQFAFTNFDYVAKTAAELLIDDQSTMKPWFVDESGADIDGFISDITEVVIPEGVERIGAYAFAGMTKLKKVVLPSTLTTIDYGAFYGCSALETVTGLENVKFINQQAFEGCSLKGVINLNNITAISTQAFAGNTKITKISLSKNLQSVGAMAFANNTGLTEVTIDSKIFKLGKYAFTGCSKLTSVSINSSVVPTGAFEGCTTLTTVKLGKDVAVIGEHAFLGTNVSSFEIAEGNTTFTPGKHAYLASGDKLLLVAPAYAGENGDGTFELGGIKTVEDSAFSGNTKIKTVRMPDVTEVGSYAFSECTALATVEFGQLTVVKNHAFHNTAIKKLPNISSLREIGNYAFAKTNLEVIDLSANDNMVIGELAFASCEKLHTVIIGNNAKIGRYAFLMDSSIFPLKNSKASTWEVYTFMDGETELYSERRTGSKLKTLTIGDNADIGLGAFYGAHALETVTLSTNPESKTKIGDYAFSGCTSLENINLSRVTKIGAYAFSENPPYIYSSYDYLNNTFYTDDLLVDYVTGEYKRLYHATKLTTVDLSALEGDEALGEYAFLYSKELTTVILGKNLTAISEGAFGDCDKLSKIIKSEDRDNPDAENSLYNVETIGDNAFKQSAIVSIDLSSVKEIGEYAFNDSEKLVSITLGKDVTIEQGAFYFCQALSTIKDAEGGEGLNGKYTIKYLGDHAFAITAITKINLASAEYIGSLAFLKPFEDINGAPLSPVEFEVILFDPLVSAEESPLKDMGDNPFAYCIIKPFEKTIVTDSFNGKDYTETTTTFDISADIKIIDGSIYRVVPKGLELITWTGDKVANVADTTVRISAMAFAGSSVTSVTLPHTVASIGHKAFFMCNDLYFVAFSSYKAPILEEEYDSIYWLTFQNIPATGEYPLDVVENPDDSTEEEGDGEAEEDEGDKKTDSTVVVGLGIVPYYMHNISAEMASNGFYGATFVNYIGHVDNKIIMIAPSNGKYYDSFIFAQYFSTTIPGKAAADETTLSVIDIISRLPDSGDITLDHKTLVEDARLLYNKLTTEEQRALVLDYGRLTEAEERIKTLLYIEEQNKPVETPPTASPEEPAKTNNIVTIVIIVVASVLGLGIIVAAVVFIMSKISASAASSNEDIKFEVAKDDVAEEPVKEDEKEEEISEEETVFEEESPSEEKNSDTEEVTEE